MTFNKWGPHKRGGKIGAPSPKRCYFIAIGLFSVNTVADRHKHAAYHNKHWRLLVMSTSMTFNDLEPRK